MGEGGGVKREGGGGAGEGHPHRAPARTPLDPLRPPSLTPAARTLNTPRFMPRTRVQPAARAARRDIPGLLRRRYK